jgi:hypothetical protein
MFFSSFLSSSTTKTAVNELYRVYLGKERKEKSMREQGERENKERDGNRQGERRGEGKEEKGGGDDGGGRR